MKILHVIPNLIKGGAQRITIDICRELNQRDGIEVLLVYFDGQNEFAHLTKEIRIQKINIEYQLSFSKKHQINIDDYENIVDDFLPDIIHSHLYLAELVSRENPRENIKYYTHCHDNIRQFKKPSFSTFSKKQYLVEAFERARLMKKYKTCKNYFIAISSDGSNYLQKNLPKVLRSSVFLLHNAIDLSSFRRKKIDDLQNAFSLVNVGNFVSNKNQGFLIEVVAFIRSKGIRIPLKLIGDGPTMNEVIKKTEELDLYDLINFKGKIDNIGSVLRESSIYVHSAKSEQFGLAILEAMAVGLPVVSLDGVGNRDLIEDGKNGFLVNQEDIERFATCIIALLNDTKLYNSFQEMSYKTAMSHDIQPYVDRLLEIYSKSKL